MPPFSNCPAPNRGSHTFNDIERRALLQIARHAIVEAIVHGRDWQPESVPENLAAVGSAFVTLMVRGRLRGCVGTSAAQDSLANTVARCAVAAATEDTRFNPIKPEEVPGLFIEISILSSLTPIKPDEIEIGLHGLVVEQGAFRGILLPPVPVERRWARERFLAETCGKAGLPEDAWKSAETQLLAFTAEVISEAEITSTGSPIPESAHR